MIVKVIIPAYNEEESIGRVVADIPDSLVDEIVVVDNGSADATAEMARKAGATVIRENTPGYGSACLTGIRYITSGDCDIIVFLDGDYSDYPEDLEAILSPIFSGEADFVIGSRAIGSREPGAMAPHQRFGNWLATKLLKLIYGVTYTDLGPFRAIKRSVLQKLKMEDRNYGWTVEMQIKAAKYKLRVAEVPVRYRKRIGTSKVSGTLRGSVMAGYKILWTLYRYR